jgi:hypothetical protein
MFYVYIMYWFSFGKEKQQNLIDKLLIVPQVKSNNRGHNMTFFFFLETNGSSVDQPIINLLLMTEHLFIS